MVAGTRINAMSGNELHINLQAQKSDRVVAFYLKNPRIRGFHRFFHRLHVNFRLKLA